MKIHRDRKGQIYLARMYDDAQVERRKHMSDQEAWLDLMEEFREAARLRTTLYEHELSKSVPRVQPGWGSARLCRDALIRLWGEHYEDMTPRAASSVAADAFKRAPTARRLKGNRSSGRPSRLQGFL
jgi:hypothetical protein